jgi:hypothetical protein
MAEIKKDVQYPVIPSSFNSEQKIFCESLMKVIKDLRSELISKQDWIPVTYINNWVDYNVNYHSEYFKDILGFVHIRIGCKNGSDIYPFTMPAGYRPEHYKLFLIRSPVYSVIPHIRFYEDGTVLFDAYDNSYCVHGEIIYRAA